VSTRTLGEWTAQVPKQMTTVLLVDDDPLQAYVRRSLLERHFSNVERAADAAEAFILVEDPLFAERLALVVVGLNRPGMGSRAFVAELVDRLPSVPVLVLGRVGEDAALFSGQNVRFLPRTVNSDQMLAVSRQMTEHYIAKTA
jgi:CheY-like chemotaxis protein